MFIDEVGASEQINNINRVSKSNNKSTDKVNSSKTDRLDLSKSSKFQSAMNEAIEKAPDIREDVVQEISSKIEENAYVIDNAQIADKIMEDTEHDGLRTELFG